jgi:hypothetical protein
LLDSILVLNYLHLAGGPLRAPGTTHAWLDPTPDGLGCGR